MNWLKIAVALAPVMLAALVGIAWSNSHTLAVLSKQVESEEKQLDRLRDVVDQRLTCPPVTPRQP